MPLLADLLHVVAGAVGSVASVAKLTLRVSCGRTTADPRLPTVNGSVDRIGTVEPKEEDMFTGIRKTIVAGVLTGFAALVGVGASGSAVCQTDDCLPSRPPPTTEHQVAPAPAETGLELEWGTGAAPRYVPAHWTGPTFAQLRGTGPLYELRWGNGGPPVLVRINTD